MENIGITIKQPWANLICSGLAQFDVRKYELEYRGPIIIHAGKTVDFNSAKRLRVDPTPTGALIGIANLTEILSVDEFDYYDLRFSHLRSGLRPYANRTFLWRFSDSSFFRHPIKASGAPGLFQVSSRDFPTLNTEILQAKNKGIQTNLFT